MNAADLQGEVFVLWRPDRAERYPELVDAVTAFDAGSRPAAQAAAEWLQEEGLRVPAESVPRLFVRSGELLGFYALANGSVELRSKARKAVGVNRPTQPAVIVTWMAKSASHEVDGTQLLNHAIGAAQKAAEESAATVLALDPFDEETAKMWAVKGFRNSQTPIHGHDSLKRMWIPLEAA